MFKRKPKIKVIAVTHEVRDVVQEISQSMGYISVGTTTKETTTKDVHFTIVLGTKDGEMFSREFNGEWSMNDIKKWEDL